MGRIVDLGRRIELVPIDPHFHDITIALYRQQRGERTVFLVHTYSSLEGADARIQAVVQAMQTLGGMLKTPDSLLYFPCGVGHEAACRRVFLEACKLTQNVPVEPRPLHTLDRKSKLTMTVSSMGNGTYRVGTDGEGRSATRRVAAIAGGLMKLGDMTRVEENSKDTVAFPCAHPHDALVGLLLVRAPNVRIVLREEEIGAARGTLAAPSQQT